MFSKLGITWSSLQPLLKSRSSLYWLGSVTVLLALKRLLSSSCPHQIIYYEDSVVFITGCDSGLGYSMAIYCKEELNLNVIATCINNNSAGAVGLRNRGILVVELDLSQEESIDKCFHFVRTFLEHHNLNLKIFVNNAAVMSFGEFDWQPYNSIEREININLLGPIKLTKLFMDLILINKTRLINICSHCSLETLPGLVPYGLSKAAVLAWTNGLRAELDKYQVKVVAVIPGTFYTQSSIMSKPNNYIEMMRTRMTQRPDPIQVMYSDYFNTYMNYVSFISKYSVTLEEPIVIEDDQIMRNIHKALIDNNPRALYMCNNQFRYTFYHTLFRFLPISYLKDRLIVYFMQMPRYCDFDTNIKVRTH